MAFFKPKDKMKVSYKNDIPKNDWDYNASKKKNQEEIDRILDKISKHGYGSLSKKEKDFLFKQGKS